jgi:hypothetical protein
MLQMPCVFLGELSAYVTGQTLRRWQHVCKMWYDFLIVDYSCSYRCGAVGIVQYGYISGFNN